MEKSTRSFALLTALGALTVGQVHPASAVAADSAPQSKPANSLAALFPDTVVARGKGIEVKRSQLDEEVTRIKSQAAAHGQNIPPEHAQMLEQNVLDQLIQSQILKNKASEADKLAGKSLAERHLADARTQLGSEERLNLRLKAQGLTLDELMAKWTESGIVQSVLEHEFKINVTDEDVKKFYDDNPAKFEQPEKVRASHILLGTKDMTTNKELPDDKKAAKRKLAEDILKRARAGEDFAKLAKEFSEDPGSKDNGGEYTFPRGQMVAEFEAAAFSLKPNEVSDIVTTQFGYHIIKLSEKLPAKKLELAKVSSDLKENLKQQELRKHQSEIKDYFNKLRKDANVEILDEKLKLKEEPDNAGLPAGHPPVTSGKKTEAK